MKLDQLLPKLPKDVVADARHDAVLSLLTSNARPLWEKGANSVATLPVTLALSTALQRAFAFGQAAQGLEQITKVMANEQAGLDALLAKTPDKPQSPRISRILFMTDDGSTRFYRECDSLLSLYPRRLLGCRLAIGGEEFGAAILGNPKGVTKLLRAALALDKKATSQILLSLVPGA